MNVRHILIAAIVCLVSPTTLIAQEGWYFGMEIGPAIAPGMRIDESDNDWSTQCDLINNPEQVEVGEGSCVNAPPPGAWYNDIEGASGAMGGLTVGYTFKHIRIEGESSFRTVNYGGSVPMVIGDVTTQEKENNELEVAEGGVGDVYTFRLGANALFHRGPFYAGGGVGIVAVGLDRHSRWKRNDDPAQIATFDDPIMKARLRARHRSPTKDFKTPGRLPAYCWLRSCAKRTGGDRIENTMDETVEVRRWRTLYTATQPRIERRARVRRALPDHHERLVSGWPDAHDEIPTLILGILPCQALSIIP